MAGEDLAERLARWLNTDGVAPALERPVAVVGIERLSGGASRQSFAVEVATGVVDITTPDHDAPHHHLVVQRKRRGALGAAMCDEAALVRAAGQAGVPVADVLCATDDPASLGGGAMVVTRVPGEALAQTILRSSDFERARPHLLAEAAAALAGVARIDSSAPGLGWLRNDDPVMLLAELHRGLGVHQPVIELALRWLDAHRPPPPSVPRVVHGDFRLGNLVVAPAPAAEAPGGALGAVLDWELAHLGDPAEDLAWACVKAWRFGERSPALGLGSVEDWVEAYASAGGDPPDVDRLRWWLVCGTLRWAVICELQASAHLSGLVDSIELAVLGRRVAESEHDLLGLLGLLPPSGPAPTEPATPTPEAPHDAPSVDELLAAVERFVGGNVVEATAGQTRFHARVAANAVAMVRRQLADGSASAAAHQRRLARLGVDSDAELAGAIAGGAFDSDLNGVGAALAEAVVDKLSVANPAYLTTPPADPWA